MMRAPIVLRIDTAPLDAALASLSEVAQTSSEVVQRFLDGLDSASQLVGLDSDDVLATGAGDLWVVFQPSDLLVEFLLAARAGECNGL